MKKYLITSTRTGAGKTTISLGILLNSKEKYSVSYFKPFGDHMVTRKKKLCDRDAELMVDALDLGADPCGLSVAFDYETLIEDMDVKQLKASISKRGEKIFSSGELCLIESARNFSYGAFMGFDAVSLSELLDASMILVADGDAGLIVDKCILVEHVIKSRKAALAGVVINNVHESDLDRVRSVAVPALEKLRVALLGIVPHSPTLYQTTAQLVTERLGAKLLAGEKGTGKSIGKILVGAMRADTALQMRSLYEPNKLIITGGDRVDMIMMAFDTSTSCIVLTGNLVPHPRILARADELEIPMISVPMDTYTTAQMVERIKAETRSDDTRKLEIIKSLVRDEIELEKL